MYGCKYTNYNAVTEQGYDQWGNLQCIYASCDDIPEFGCIYPDGFGAFNEGFDATHVYHMVEHLVRKSVVMYQDVLIRMLQTIMLQQQ